MRQRLHVLLYLACVAVPVLIGGVLVLRLLGREEARMRSESRAALQERAQLAADNISASVRDVQEVLLSAIKSLPTERRADALQALRSSNPLVRNIFVTAADGSLRMPNPAGLLSDEERAFVERYAPFWEGRQVFAPSVLRETAAAMGRQSLYETASKSVDLVLPRARQTRAVPPSSSGWVQWFHEGQLFLLAWVRDADGGVYGLELERVALESRLQTVLPRPSGRGEGIALGDGSNRMVAQAGAIPEGGAVTPDFRVPVGPVLPHWEVLLFAPPGAGMGPAWTFRVLAAVLVLGLAVAVLAGGVLLYREAQRQWVDAQQKTSFVANVSHELRTPLTTIRMYGEMLAEGRVADETRQRSYLQTIVRESQRLTRLVNHVLEFGRMEMNRTSFRVEDLSVPPWIECLVAEQQPRVTEAGMRLDVQMASDVVPVRADRDAASQILLNLLDNAIKYASSGTDLVIAVSREGREVVLRVMDRGPGVPEGMRERIFDKFFRVDQSLTSGVAGSGLGLSIARRLAREMGGDLVCRDREGGGASFECRLPAAEGAG